METKIDTKEVTAQMMVENRESGIDPAIINLILLNCLEPRENVPFNHPWSKQAQNDKVGLFQSRILVFFCDNNCGELHQCSTMTLDKELRQMET